MNNDILEKQEVHYQDEDMSTPSKAQPAEFVTDWLRIVKEHFQSS